MTKRSPVEHVVAPLLVLCLLACQPSEAPPTFAEQVLTQSVATAPSAPSASAYIPGSQPTPTAALQRGLVLDVIDGDTVDVAIDGQVHRVRYLGVNTPEEGSKSYLIAKDLNRSLVYRREVQLEGDVRDKDQYGRLLRHVFVDGVHVNVELLRSGWARLLIIPPNEKYSDIMIGAQREAAEDMRGLWQRPDGLTPQAGD